MFVKPIVAALLLAGMVGAQASATSIYIPDSSPVTGSLELIPMGQGQSSTTYQNQRYQALIPRSLANTILINDLGFAASTSGLHHFDSIVIKMDIVPSTQTALDPTFSKNLSTKAVTVLHVRNYDWHVKKDQWNRIGLQRDYFWVPKQGNLVIDIEVRGAGALLGNSGGFRASDKVERLYAHGWKTSPPAQGNTTPSMAALKLELVSTDAETSLLGQGCSGTSGIPTMTFSGSAQIGKSFSIHLSQAVPGSIAVYVFGGSNAAPTFPIDLSPMGAAGCKLYVSPDIQFPVATGTGSSVLPLQVPLDTTLVGLRMWNQVFVFDKSANKLGIVTSNCGRIRVGS